MGSNRLSRFKRSEKIAAFRLTERDREILKHVHRHRFLRSDHLCALLPGSPQQVLRRLQLLYYHSFLERPLCQSHNDAPESRATRRGRYAVDDEQSCVR
jgi:hypothetical protein